MNSECKQAKKARNFHRRAFTLVEVLVAVTIMIIVAVIIVTAVSSIDQKSRIAKTQAQMKILTEGITAFKSATGFFPLAVPEDAWDSARNWDHIDSTTPPVEDDFVAVMWGHRNNTRWHNYFVPSSSHRPDFTWSVGNPTNIHMLGFQLEQVPESNQIFNQIKETNTVTFQKTFTHPGPGVGVETWSNASDLCKLRHPLDASDLRTVYQMQDAWGMPLRFWTSDTLAWAKVNNATITKSSWNTSIQSLLSSKLQQANWGFIIESAGKDGKFGWWGQSGIDLTTTPYSQQVADNVYSVGE